MAGLTVGCLCPWVCSSSWGSRARQLEGLGSVGDGCCGILAVECLHTRIYASGLGAVVFVTAAQDAHQTDVGVFLGVFFRVWVLLGMV